MTATELVRILVEEIQNPDNASVHRTELHTNVLRAVMKRTRGNVSPHVVSELATMEIWGE